MHFDIFWARAAADAVCEMEGGLPMTHSHNVIDFALAARELREKRVADLLSHLEKAQPEGFQYIGDGRAMASPRSELATSPSAGPRRTVSYKPQTLPSIVGTCRKSFPKSAASSEPTI
jgi:hypothetical protein